IDVLPNTEYTFSHVQFLLYYNSKKEFIGRYSVKSNEERVNYTKVMPDNCFYVRLGVQLRYLDFAIMNKGSRLLEYENHLELNNKYKAKNIPEVFNGPTIPNRDNTTEDPIYEITYRGWQSLYDDLMEKFPNYITRTLLGSDQDDNPIYKYDFIPEKTPNHVNGIDFDDSNEYFKIFLTTGSHGHEKEALFSGYNMFKQLCENWNSDPILEDMRWNIHFSVIPVVCPYGVNNNQRKNGNGVDILRNLPNVWEISTHSTEPTDSTYRGVSPLSELEAKYLYEAYKKEKWDYVADFHNFFDFGDEKFNFIWVGATGK